MAQRIYRSTVPSIPVVERSVYTHLFASSDPNLVGQFPGSTPAFIDAASGATITRADLKRLTLAFGYGIRNHPQTAASRGDTVLIYSINALYWPVVLLGAVAAGLRCTLANSAYNARELEHQYSDSGASLIFTSEEGLAVARETLQNLGLTDDQADRKIVVLGSSLDWAGGPAAPRKAEAAGLLHMEDLLKLGSLTEGERFDGRLAHETVYLCYSSGTTGKPKGVETTHQNITSVLDMVMTVFPAVTVGQTTHLGILPFYHIYGAVKVLHFPFMCGTPVVIQQRFDPVQFCANVEKYKIAIALVVPPVLVLLSRHPIVDKYDMSSLEVLFSGAAPLGAALSTAVIKRLLAKRNGKTNLTVMQGYGLTETSPTTHMVPIEDGMRKVGSVGMLLPNLEARIVDGDSNGDVEEGQPGELWVRGPTIMKSYLGNKAATADAITRDRWFKTGDIARRDAEGFYYIVDRRKELIKYKGFQVPPAELESVLLTHPDIADVAVIGVYSTKEATELPRAYVVHAKPNTIRDEPSRTTFCREVESWIQTQVAYYKYLRGGIVIVDIVPKSAAGKILRRELRERAKRELEGQEPAEQHIKAKL
ncbi:AMP binding protein [Amanita rubescens]|nr:AMP binding protein [Amanita rubescens]